MWGRRWKEGIKYETAYELGERFPSGVTFCFAALSPCMTAALGDVVLDVAEADLRSV